MQCYSTPLFGNESFIFILQWYQRFDFTKIKSLTYTELHNHTLTNEYLHKSSLVTNISAPLVPTPFSSSLVFFTQRQSHQFHDQSAGGFGNSSDCCYGGRFWGGWRHNNCNSYNNNSHRNSDNYNNNYIDNSHQNGQHRSHFFYNNQWFNNRQIKCQLCYGLGHSAS